MPPAQVREIGDAQVPESSTQALSTQTIPPPHAAPFTQGTTVVVVDGRVVVVVVVLVVVDVVVLVVVDVVLVVGVTEVVVGATVVVDVGVLVVVVVRDDVVVVAGSDVVVVPQGPGVSPWARWAFTAGSATRMVSSSGVPGL